MGNHRIQGLSDEFIPEIIQKNPLDSVVQVSDGDAILMTQRLASYFGLAVGISSGANLIGAIKLQEKYGYDAVVATVFVDCNKKYLSTDLTNEEPVKAHYLSPKVELKRLIALKRLCKSLIALFFFQFSYLISEFGGEEKIQFLYSAF
jgi:cysteine synthase A